MDDALHVISDFMVRPPDPSASQSASAPLVALFFGEFDAEGGSTRFRYIFKHPLNATHNITITVMLFHVPIEGWTKLRLCDCGAPLR
jgi:hypothetical protein